jgi:hypothetical protein
MNKLININSFREKKFNETVERVMGQIGMDLKSYTRSKAILIMDTILFGEYAEKELSDAENIVIIDKITNYCLLELTKTDIFKMMGSIKFINELDKFLEEHIFDKLIHLNKFLESH